MNSKIKQLLKELFPQQNEIALVELTLKQVEQLISAGADPTLLLEATAAGAILSLEGENGSTFVTIDYLFPSTQPTAGHDTVGVLRYEDILEQNNNILLKGKAAERPAVPEVETEPKLPPDEPEPPGRPDVPDMPEPPTPEDPPEPPQPEDPEEPEEPEPKDKPHQDNGFGNGDDDAPGGSEFNNNAENAGGNHDGTSEQGNGSAHGQGLDVLIPLVPPVDLI